MDRQALGPRITHRLEYSLPPSSCEGEPAPNLAPPAVLPVPPSPFGFPKGDLSEEVPVPGSIGDELAVDEPDCGCWFADSCER